MRGRYVAGMRRWDNVERTVKARYEAVMNTVTTRWTKYDTSSPFTPPHERVHTGPISAHRPYTVILPSSYRVFTHVPPCATAVTHTAKVLNMFKTFAGVPPGPADCKRATNVFTGPSTPRRVPSPCSTVRNFFTTRWATRPYVTATLD